MAATNDRTVAVFGGTGFLGRRVVWHLRKREFFVRIVSRHLDRGHRLFGLDDPQLQSIEANIHDERSVADALAGAYGVVNAVSLYVEHGQETFHSVYVEAAQRVAAHQTIRHLRWFLAACMFLDAALYTSVGHAGASAYIALISAVRCCSRRHATYGAGSQRRFLTSCP
jgi:hypothetical protein